MKMLLGGQWVDRDEKIDVCDPFDNSVIDTVPSGKADDAELALASATAGFEITKRMSVYDRAQILYKAAGLISDRLEEFARIIAREGSKTINEARKEAGRCVNTITCSAEEAKRILGETIPWDSFPGGEKRRGYYYRFPIGVVLCITPFNDPLNLVAHKLGPAIAAGNSVILKPATVTPLSAIMLVEVLLEAGLPPNAVQLITGYGSKIGDQLVSDERVRMVSFTGGVEAGKQIASKAGIKKIGMELGSDSPVIVWKDADMQLAVESCVSGAFWAAGQNCIGVQRLLVHKDIYDEFKTEFVELTKTYKIGDKLDESTQMGPMITEAEAKRVEKWVKDAVAGGANLLTGGGRTGALVEPTVLDNVPEDAKVHCEEVFGPTVNLYPVDDLDKAIAEANALPYGLLAAIFTRDVETAFKAAYELDCGGVMINDSTDYRLDSMPFGGVKYSGLGREGLKFSLQEMTEPKVICFNLPGI
ncbi:MAG: aldehyde dehydrogenase family protein [candidate division Zixibacteria bacterium]|nr:aldehyde dehydrogenase family protein [candidate division Zixibacteria bacterium]MDH3938457.1 aldehyde dehydrogenase family protein [candidate division Zixibacteria bacterium]